MRREVCDISIHSNSRVRRNGGIGRWLDYMEYQARIGSVDDDCRNM